MPVKDQAAYMREYRAKRKAVQPQLERLAEVYETGGKIVRAADPIAEMARLLAEAQDEIRRLKRELAARPSVERATVQPLDRDMQTAIAVNSGERNPYAEYRPVPKDGPKPKR